MAAGSGLDDEFMQYWLRLSPGQKESLLNVAKHFVGLSEETEAIDLCKQLIQEERQKHLQKDGKPSSWEELREMALNKEKRNSL
jgi:hypothetical protein